MYIFTYASSKSNVLLVEGTQGADFANRNLFGQLEIFALGLTFSSGRFEGMPHVANRCREFTLAAHSQQRCRVLLHA